MTARRRKVVAAVLIALGVLLLCAVAAVPWFLGEGRTNGSVVSGGVKRNYLLYVPKGYDRSQPTALVISLHPAASWPAAEMAISRWNGVADEHGFLVVYPSGSDTPRVWPMGRTSLAADVQYISDLIDKLASEYNLDRARIYADGISNGGGMAFALACKLGDRIAAIGAVASAQTLPWEWCGDGRPVPAMVFHGSADPVVPYKGGTSAISPRPFPGMRDWIARVARRNGCAADASETPVATSVRRLSYGNCAQGADVILYTIDGGGHTWPGGMPLPEWICGRTTREISATRLLWQFYSEHPLVAARR